MQQNNWLFSLFSLEMRGYQRCRFYACEQWVRASARGDFLSFHWSFLQWRHCLENWWSTFYRYARLKDPFIFWKNTVSSTWLIFLFFFLFILLFVQKKPSNIKHPQHSSSNKSKSSETRKKRKKDVFCSSYANGYEETNREEVSKEGIKDQSSRKN